MADSSARPWAAEAIRRLALDARRSGPTPLVPLRFPAFPEIDIYLKDESAQPTGSVKHRLVRTMFREAIAGGTLTEGTEVVAATSGAVAVAGAYFARLVGLGFTTVLPSSTPPSALARIGEYGGRWRFGELPPAAVQDEARDLAGRSGGYFLDHFAGAVEAGRADGEGTVAEEVFAGLREERFPDPAWIVTGAGTGATSAGIGRYLRRRGLSTRLAVVDPENSAYFPAWASGCDDYATGMPSRIPGIGRPRTEPGFVPDLIDLVIPVPDGASVAAMRRLHRHPGIECGPAAGTGLWGVCHLVARMRRAERRGSVVALSGDHAEAYRGTYLDGEWLAAKGLDPMPYETVLDRFAESGEWPG